MTIKNKSRIILEYIGFVIIMAMLTISVSTIWIMGVDELENIYVMNISFDILGIAISAIIYYGNLFKVENYDNAQFIFSNLLVLNSIELFTDIIAWLVQGVPELASINRADNFVFYFCGMMMNMVYWYYIRSLTKSNNRVDKVIMVLVYIISFISLLHVVLNIKCGFYYSVDAAGTYTRNDKYFALLYVGPALILVICFCVILSKKIDIKEKLTLLFYPIAPIIAIVVQSKVFGLSIIYSVSLCVLVIIYINIQIKRGQIIVEQEKEIKKQEISLSEQRVKILLSQMQPHFMFNGMVAIRYLIRKKPDDAILAMDNFIGYLRGSVDMLDNEGLIPFDKELQFTVNYLELEKVRFGEEVNYELNIFENDFLVPPISIQPIVENAIRHGIRQKIDGIGKVRIETGKTDTEYYVEIKDNGVGFDVDTPFSEDRSHVGMKNTRERVETLSKGRMTVASKVGFGTTVTIYIPFTEVEDNA